ncbi:hypothetical protein MD484_g5717, partial [Candolleomyces efflorescens]
MSASPPSGAGGDPRAPALPKLPTKFETAKKPATAQASRNKSAINVPYKSLATQLFRVIYSIGDGDQNQPPAASTPPVAPKDPMISTETKDKRAIINATPDRKGRLALKELCNPETNATIQKGDDNQPESRLESSHPTPLTAHEPLAAEENAAQLTPGSPLHCPGSPPYRPGSPSYLVPSPEYSWQDYFAENSPVPIRFPARKFENPLDNPKYRHVLCDLDKHVICTSNPETRERTIYFGITRKKNIDEFLQFCPYFDRRRMAWEGVYEFRLFPSSPGHSKYEVSQLTHRFSNVITSIMKDLGNYNGKRELMDASDTPLYHKEAEGMIEEFSSPTFVIRAEGPSFELPSHKGPSQGARRDRFGFTNITTCIDVVDRVAVSQAEIHAQQAVYARQIFNQQPNRKFVRTLVLTEKDVQLYHFDRSGSLSSTFPECPAHTFVRIILGLSSLDEEVLGLDTSIQWTLHPKTGEKNRGTLTIKDEETKISKTYDLRGVDPSFVQLGIIGRGTTCWPIWDGENQRTLLAKDCYRYEDSSSTPEFENLKLARDIPGCVFMVSYEANRGETVDGFDFCPCRKHIVRKQVLSRIVMEEHGKDLFGFTSELQLFQAIRDAILGHKKLLLKGAIHRDVHWSNIVLGKAGAPLGDRGVLIDFDMAKRVDKLTESRWPTGHYQSLAIAILRNALARSQEKILVHDWLDELESFFYITATIMYEFNGPHNFRDRETLPPFVQEWLETDRRGHLKENLEFKKRWILSDKPADPAAHVDAHYWSTHSLDLLRDFYVLVRYMASEKERIRSLPEEKAVEELHVLRNELEGHYDSVIYIFDGAIQDIEADLEAFEDSDHDGESRDVEDKDETDGIKSKFEDEDEDEDIQGKDKTDGIKGEFEDEEEGEQSQDLEAQGQTHGIKRELEDEGEDEDDEVFAVIRPTKRGRIDGVL